jgi:hypothetical protein
MHVEWAKDLDANGSAHWDHYSYKSAHWMGMYNLTSETYGPINHANLNHTIRAYEVLIDMYYKHPAVFGMVCSVCLCLCVCACASVYVRVYVSVSLCVCV